MTNAQRKKIQDRIVQREKNIKRINEQAEERDQLQRELQTEKLKKFFKKNQVNGPVAIPSLTQAMAMSGVDSKEPSVSLPAESMSSSGSTLSTPVVDSSKL